MIDPVLPTYARAPLQFARGNGVWLYTADGDRYLDFGAGIAVNILGHAHPKLVHALQAQAEKIWHTSNLYEIPGQQRLAERLVAATFADTVFFTNSGAEAMELAIKMARKYHSTQGNPERFRLITIDGAFHGRTMATISAAGKPKLTDGFGPLLEGFDIVEFNCVEAVRDAIGPHTAGVMLEPIQGEGGIRPFSTEVLQGIRRLCDEHGLLLILDEIQCGMGRTGKLFAHEWANITPDILAAAKGIGGGFPLGACLATATAAAGMGVGTHGSTYGGNPLAMAVGNAVLDVVLEDDFLATVQRRAGFLQQRLGAIAAEHPHVVETVRGEGLMLGMKCKIPVAEVVASCHQNHLLTIAAAEDTVRIVPPLNITEEELAEGCEALDRALAALHDSATDSAGAPA